MCVEQMEELHMFRRASWHMRPTAGNCVYAGLKEPSLPGRNEARCRSCRRASWQCRWGTFASQQSRARVCRRGVCDGLAARCAATLTSAGRFA
jgi:hypothetical protein